MSHRWDHVTLVIPVKRLDRAKTRLDVPVGLRRSLALAFCVDTVSAAARAPRVRDVLVVTSDQEVAHALRNLPVRVLAESGAGHAAAVAHGWALSAAQHPHAAVAVLPADLPCLRTIDLDDALEQAARCQAGFVPDLGGHGTTLLVAPSDGGGLARYGPGSAAAHAALGLSQLAGRPGLRLDVDELIDLDVAWAYGLGPCSAAALEQARRGTPGSASDQLDSSAGLGIPARCRELQATHTGSPVAPTSTRGTGHVASGRPSSDPNDRSRTPSCSGSWTGS